MRTKRVKHYSWRGLEGVFALAQRGDREPREQIFSFLCARLLPVAKPRLSEEAEDVVQETLMVVDAHFSELETFGRLVAFAHQVLRHKIGNVYHRRVRERDLRVELKNTREPRCDTDCHLNAVELDRIIRESIDKVGEKRYYCKAILLGLYEGLSPSEISVRLGISKSKLKVQTCRCRQALRKILSEEYDLLV